ncbi:MAG TPA: YceI family protein [Thermoanaerobaculia bacterium]|jgi:polyisoprenoid-binding protein YceI|nr:YceI family protein [Thermoanaerobaculia bacterium]
MRIARLFIALTLFAAAAMHAQDARIAMIDAEVFGIDRSHSHLGFTIGFLGMSKVRGTFNDYTATILYDDAKPERSSITMVIEAKSIDTHGEMRDRDLQAAPWFDTEKHPRIVFQSTRIERKGKERYLVHGELTMKGVTRALTIPMTRTVPRTPDAGWGNIRIGGTGAVTISRHDFGIDGPEFWGKALTDAVEIEIDLLGSRPNYDRWGFQSKEKPSIGEVLAKTLESSDAAAAAAQFRELRAQKPDDYNFGPGQLGTLIHRLVQHRKLADALTLLAVAVEAYPEEAGFHARMGEAYAALGDKPRAIAAYEKAQALNPWGTEAKEMLRRLKG